MRKSLILFEKNSVCWNVKSNLCLMTCCLNLVLCRGSARGTWYKLSYWCSCTIFFKFWYSSFLFWSLRLSSTQPDSEVRKDIHLITSYINLSFLNSKVALFTNFLFQYFFKWFYFPFLLIFNLILFFCGKCMLLRISDFFYFFYLSLKKKKKGTPIFYYYCK